LKAAGTKQENDSIPINGSDETTMTEDPYNLTGKGKKALHRVKAIDEEVEKINKQLTRARITLEKRANPVSEDEKKKKKSEVW